MENELLARKIEEAKVEIARLAAERIVLLKLKTYWTLNSSQMAQLLIPGIDQFLRFLRSNDLTEFKTYVKKVFEARNYNSHFVDDFRTVTQILMESFDTVVESDPSDAASSNFLPLLQRHMTLILAALKQLSDVNQQ